MYMTYATIIPVLFYLLITLALAVSAVRLMWIAGSYVKRKQDQLSKNPADQA